MIAAFDRPDVLAAVVRGAQGGPVVVTGPPGAGKTTLLHAAAEALAAEGWRASLLDLQGAASSPERFVLAALRALPEGLEGRAAEKAQEAERLAHGGHGEGARAVHALFAAWSLAAAAAGRPLALLLDEATEIRSLAYFGGLREVDQPFAAALGARRCGTVLATALPRLSHRLWPTFATIALPVLSAAELQAEARRRGLRSDGGALAAMSFGLPCYARVLLERLEQGARLLDAWVEEMSLGGRLERACRHTYEVLLLRSRGYGMSKAVLAAVAAEEGLNLTALVSRLGRTPGAIRDYLGWLLDVDVLRVARKRYFYVDGLLRTWVRLHAAGVPALEEDVLAAGRALLDSAPAPVPEPVTAASRHQGLMEID